MAKRIYFLCFVLAAIAFQAEAQRLIIHDLDENENETGTREISVGDVIIIAHQKKNKKVHYFQGKVTGIFKDRNVIRVFDYARSTRVVSIVGKKIDIDEIVGVELVDKADNQQRQNRAVGAAIAGSIGAGLGSKTGNAISYGAAAGSILNDATTREKIGKQRITTEIVEY